MFVIPLWELGNKCIISLGLLAILDFGWAYHTKARYFALHGLWNIIITVAVMPDFIQTITHPLNALGIHNDPSRWPIIFVAMIHLWHCLAYNGLTWDDYFHHIVFASILCSVNLIWEWGYGSNFMIFFICGFPGGIDYLLLLAVKHGYIEKITEKEINNMLNIWCRGPGCIASACIIWVNWMAGNTGHIPSIVQIMTMGLSIFNGQYYARRVVVSWVKHDMNKNTNKNMDSVDNNSNNSNNSNNNSNSTCDYCYQTDLTIDIYTCVICERKVCLNDMSSIMTKCCNKCYTNINNYI